MDEIPQAEFLKLKCNALHFSLGVSQFVKLLKNETLTIYL